MEEFEIPVVYKNKELNIPAKLVVAGYTYRIETEVEGNTIWFEPDEERNFRALLPPDADASAKLPDGELLQIIAHALHEALA